MGVVKVWKEGDSEIHFTDLAASSLCHTFCFISTFRKADDVEPCYTNSWSYQFIIGVSDIYIYIYIHFVGSIVRY